MSSSLKVQDRIDAYLMNLRRCLGKLPAEDVADILQEIRGHILERAEARGELTDERLVEILKALGRPEDIGPLYQAEALVARARTSRSPVLILRATLRWATLSVAGVVALFLGTCGYLLAAAFLLITPLAALPGLNPPLAALKAGWMDGSGGEPPSWRVGLVCFAIAGIIFFFVTRSLRFLLRYFRTNLPGRTKA